jgi:gamma-glutamylcyclotransferase (GGCT)/AIG2-like uncharacterized protein YtfP
MKTIFVYGILQKHHSALDFGMTDDMYRGEATISSFKRESLVHISKTEIPNSKVHGELWEVPDDIEEHIYQFEAQFGYERVSLIVEDANGEYVNAILYLVDWKDET